MKLQEIEDQRQTIIHSKNYYGMSSNIKHFNTVSTGNSTFYCGIQGITNNPKFHSKLCYYMLIVLYFCIVYATLASHKLCHNIYEIISVKLYQCTAVHIDQSNDYLNFFSVDLSNLIGCPRCPLYKIIDIQAVYTGTKLSRLLWYE